LSSAAVWALAVTVFCTSPSLARTLTVESPAAKAAFSDSGDYRVDCRETRWVLQGALSGKPYAVTSRSGADRLGEWREVEARTPGEVTAIRVYEDEPVVLFCSSTRPDERWCWHPPITFWSRA